MKARYCGNSVLLRFSAENHKRMPKSLDLNVSLMFSKLKMLLLRQKTKQIKNLKLQ